MSLDFQKILCPVDLSAFSLEAVKLAARVAESSGATLYILHVVDNPYDDLYMSSITQADPALLEFYKAEPQQRAQAWERIKAHAAVLLKQFCYDFVQHVPRAHFVVESGNPFEVIMDVAETNGVDLIVLATHGRTGLKRLLIGNVAEKVVRHAACPVLTVKPRLEESENKASGS